MTKAFFKRRWFWRLLLLLAVLVVGIAPIWGQQPKPSQIMDQYRAQRITWTTNIWPYANTLFGILALIEFAWSAAVMLLERSDLQSWTAALLRKLMWIGGFYALLLNGRTWIPAIIDSFEQIGQTSSGFNSIAPSDVFAQGIDIAGALMDAASTSAFFTNTGVCLSLVVAAALIVLAFSGICIQFIVAMVESYIVVAAGYLFLGFGGSRWTAPYTERYIGLAVSTGVKIMLLYLLIGTGMNVSVTWMSDAQQVSTSAHPAMGAFEIMGAALIFLMLCWQVPKLFSAVLGGAPALTGGDLISIGTGAVAGAATIATVSAGGAAMTTRAAAALGGISPAAAAGGTGTVGASVAAVGVSGRSSGGAAGGGTVPPPSSPFSGPPSNGRPRQPDPPPFTRGSGGASSELTGTRAGSSPQQRSSGASNGNGNGRGENSARSVLSAIGGENLAGSGFENERPASGFTAVSAPLTTNRAVAPPPMSSGTAPNSDTFGEKDPPPRVTGFSGHNGGSGPSPDRGGQNNNPRPEAQSSRSAKFEAVPVPDPGTAGQQTPTQNGRENPPSRARNADQALSGAANRLRGIRNQLGGLPSDAAPHATPPRMPIDHHE